MRLAALTSDLEKAFWDYVRQDYCDYYFFIYDWLLEKEKTQIFLALNGDVIAGLMLIYEGNIVQLRGPLDVVGFMLDNLQLEGFALQVPVECEQLLSERFSNYTLKEHVILMEMEAGEEHLCVNEAIERLIVDDADAVAELMRQSYPEMWSDVTADYVRQHFRLEAAFWVGIKYGGRLAAFGYGVLTPKVSHVTWIATHQLWRNRGYATSIVSALTNECLKNSSSAIIYVMDNNPTAKGIYMKVGFKPYKQYIFLKT